MARKIEERKVRLLNKKVAVFYYDSPDHVARKDGTLQDWDNKCITIDIEISRPTEENRFTPIFKSISFPIDKVIRVEESKSINNQ